MTQSHRTGRTLVSLLAAAMILGGLSPLASARQATPAVDDQHVAVVLLNFTDRTVPDTQQFRDEVERDYFDSDGSLHSYYLEASDQRIGFAPVQGQPAVLGPWTTDIAHTCDAGAVRSKAIAELDERGITDWDYLSVVADFDCGWAGLGQQPGNTTWMPDWTYGDAGSMNHALIHEIGHNLGYRHQYTLDCPEGSLNDCSESGGTVGNSPMGGGGMDSGLSGPELMYSGWVRSGQRVGDAAGTYDLVPLHAPADVSGPRILEIPYDGGGGTYVVEYRLEGNTLDTNTPEGVFVYRGDADGYHTSRVVDTTPDVSGDADLAAGKSVTDSTTGVTITVHSVGSTARVEVQPASAASGPITGVGGKCVDVEGGGSTDGTPLVLWGCHGGANQTWTLPGDGTIRTLGKCMDVDGGGATNGTAVQLWTCNGTPAQQWEHTADGTLVNPGSGRCLDAEGGSSANGTRLVIWDCHGGAHQRWTLPS